MAFTTLIKFVPAAILYLFVANGNAASIGLPTRDQNPLLQAYYLPSIDIQTDYGWHVSHSLFITNTFQDEDNRKEVLVIDGENYRYDFALDYQSQAWRFGIDIPFIANDAGSLDSVIEEWHDIFGLPQGGRTRNKDDQLNYFYSRNGITIFEQTDSDSDIGDIALSLNYNLLRGDSSRTELGFGIELPTGSIESNSGNEAVDMAFWINRSTQISDRSRFYGQLGLSLPDEGGQLKNRIKNQIWFSQLGSEYDFTDHITGILQFDFHSATLKNSKLDAFGNSLQVQLALQFKNWFDDYQIDLFFSEDILVKTAPDITFGLRLSRNTFD